MRDSDYIKGALSFEVWRSGREIRDIAIAAAITNEDWGPVSFLISLFSKKGASWWLEQFSGIRYKLYVVLARLVEEGAAYKRVVEASSEALEDPNYLPKREYLARPQGRRDHERSARFAPVAAT